MNPSIVDYLNSQGQNSSFSARKTLAESAGISGYIGSATQNAQLLNTLKKSTQENPIGTGPFAGMTSSELATLQNSPDFVPPSSSEPTPITQNPGESPAAFKARILASPFELAGGLVNPAGEGLRGPALPPPGKFFNSEGILEDINPPAGTTRNAEGKIVPIINRSIRSGRGTEQNVVAPDASGSTSRFTDAAGLSQAEIEAQKYLDQSIEKPKTTTEIANERTLASKEKIQALNDFYASQKALQAPGQEMRTREANAMAVLRGLQGSQEADTLAEGAIAKNTAETRALEAEKTMKLINIYSDIQDFAEKEAIRQKEVATGQAKDVLEKGANARKEAIDHLGLIATNPQFNLDNIKEQDPDTYSALAQSVGGEEIMKGIVFSKRPKSAILGSTQRIGNSMVQNVRQPDGSIKMEWVSIPQDVLASDPKNNKIVDTDNGSFISNDGGKTYTPLANSMKPVAPKATTTVSKASVITDAGTQRAYVNDLDAIIGRVPLIIPSENGKVAFNNAISKARDDGDKINTVATAVLRNSPAPVRDDFSNQAKAVKSIDKAIALIDNGMKSGFLQNAEQYTFNVFGKDFDPKLAAVNAYITSAIQPYRASITGAAWGTQEDTEYKNLFGSIKYSPTELKERLVRIKEIMKDNSATALNMQINPVDTGYNPFTPKKSIDDYRQEFPQASDEELTALMNEETQ